MNRLTCFVLRHRRAVGIVWLIVFAAGVGAATSVSGHLSQQFSLPGQKAYETNQRIVRRYGNGGAGDPVAVVITLRGTETVDSPGVTSSIGRALGEVSAAQPPASGPPPRGTFRVLSYANTRDRRFVSTDGRTTVALVFAAPAGGFAPVNTGPTILAALARAPIPGATMQLTGLDLLQAGGRGGGTSVLVETLLGAVGALLVLALVFGSFVAVVPIIIAAVSIVSTLLVILGLTQIADVSFIVQFLVALIGLGVAIDYSLLVVTRWREERHAGAENLAAVTSAMETAGRSVAFSGVTVAVGLFALVSLPVPYLRSVGYAGMLIPLISVIVTLTLLPVLLATIGPRLDWPHTRTKGLGRSVRWTAWARGVIRFRWAAVVAASAALVLLAVVALGLRVGDPKADSLAKSGPAREGLVTLEHSGLPTGFLTPVEIDVPAVDDPHQVMHTASAIGGVYAAVAPDAAAWRRPGSALVEVIPQAETSTARGKATIHELRKVLPPPVGIGGDGAQQLDFTNAVYGTFPYTVALIVILTYLLLVRAFRSLLLPLKAVILNIVSVAATYGLLVLIWQDGFGSKLIWGISATGTITNWIPLMVFAFLFGLSMDYEVFILTRMREAYDTTHDTSSAIVEGLGHTGRLVTSAALILFLAFTALASGPNTSLKILATGLGIGILLDATVVRALLVPATISLFGRWNWWLPEGIARILRVEPSPLLDPTITAQPPPHRPTAAPSRLPAA